MGSVSIHRPESPADLAQTQINQGLKAPPDQPFHKSTSMYQLCQPNELIGVYHKLSESRVVYTIPEWGNSASQDSAHQGLKDGHHYLLPNL